MNEYSFGQLRELSNKPQGFLHYLLNGPRAAARAASVAGAALCCAMLLSGAVVQAQEVSAENSLAVAQTPVVDINSADATQLAEGLNGVGLSKADAIVRYREQFGPFESVDELSEVQGIGAATVERNRTRIRLR